MQRADKLACAGEVKVELARPIQGIGEFCIVGSRMSPLYLIGKPKGDTFVFLQIQGNERIELAGIGDRRDISQVQPRGRIKSALDAGAVIRFDAIEIEIHELGCGQLFCAKSAMNFGNRRLFETEALGFRRAGVCA